LALGLAACVVLGGFIWWTHWSSADPPEDDSDNGPPLFEDVTNKSRVDFTFRNGQEARQYAILDSLGGGIGLFDYDGDGLLDIFIPGGGYFQTNEAGQITAVKGHPCKLYKNLGNFKFKDVTREVGLDKIDFYTHGCAIGDYDRDGWPDLLVTGWEKVALFRNVPVKGGRRFQDVTATAKLTAYYRTTSDQLLIGNLIGSPTAKVTGSSWTTSAAWVDLKGDGNPDLYLCQYVSWSPHNNPKCPGYTKDYPRDVCPPRTFPGRDHLLFRNNGNGTFTNVSREAGLNFWGKTEQRGDQQQKVEVGKGLGVIAVDVNMDGRPDIYVANDTVNKLLYLNHPRHGYFRRDIRLHEAALHLGVAVDIEGAANGSMGLAVSDFDCSGFPSLFVTNYEDEMHSLYQNHGHESFTFETENLGIMAIGQQYVGFGTSFLDLENRGWEDIIITNGHVIWHPARAPLKQRPVLFRNEQGNHFKAITAQGGPYFRTSHCGRGLAVGDLDNDGRPDVVISHVNDPVVILRNVAGGSGKRNHWLGFELVGRENRDLAGTRIVVEAGGRKRTRFVIGGGSYLSASDPRHIFGLGDLENVERVTVYWSWTDPKKGQVFEGEQFKVDAYWRLEEGKKEVESAAKPRKR
jgi:hypothetical protein